MPRPGDLVFFPSHGNLLDRLILLRTKVPGDPAEDYTHVEIVVSVDAKTSAIETIGALARGVVRHPLPSGGILINTSAECIAARLPAGLAWLQKRVGNEYGVLDILAQGATWLDPKAPFLTERNRLDCSDLAARFLWIAGFPLPAELIDSPELVSPNSLHRAVTAVLAAS